MLSRLPFGSIRPTGWLARRMRRDLDGFVGCLDRLVPDLIVEDDVYGADRRTSTVTTMDVGALSDVDAEHAEQFLWWNSETQSNWRDGWARHVLVVGHEHERAAVRAAVDRLVATADPDGYLGIYAPELRFPATGENGKLWAQATLGRFLLGYAEAAEDRTHAATVLDAVAKAARTTMSAWPAGTSRPFPADGYVGAAHGLMVIDVFDRLTGLIGDQSFGRYAAWIYRAYSASASPEEDAKLGSLLDPQRRFVGHGVHTYEHLRALVVAHQVEGAADLEQALTSYQQRLRSCLTPAHGPIGDEWIGGRQADATSTGYELCSTVELLDSLIRMIAASGDLRWGDDAEAVALNAGLGAWHPSLPAIAYLQTDNAVTMTGAGPRAALEPHQTRYRYSPVHREAAVCCAANAGRLLPTYLGGAVMQEHDGVVIVLFGPMRSQHVVHGVTVVIEQVTEYPDGPMVEIHVATAQPVAFRLTLRRPMWTERAEVLVDGQAPREPGASPVASDEFVMPGMTDVAISDRVVLFGRWHANAVSVRFDWIPRVRSDLRGDGYVTVGPRVMSLPIPSRTTVTRQHAVPGFVDVTEVAACADHDGLRLVADGSEPLRIVAGGVDVPFTRTVRSAGADRPEVVRRAMVPQGTSALRRVTFPLAGSLHSTRRRLVTDERRIAR